MNEVSAALLIALASTGASSAVKSGDHLFFRAQIVDCGDAGAITRALVARVTT